jgi:heptose I phosphotransferase
LNLRRTAWTTYATADWRALAPREPDAVMAAQLRDRFHAKQGRSIARWTLGDGRLVVYLKRHHRESWLRSAWSLVVGARASSALREFRRLRWAASVGLTVPRAVAAGAGVGPFARLQGYLAVEELTAMAALHELIPAAMNSMAPAAFLAWKRGLVGEVARVVGELHDHRRYHKDLYLCHFFAPERFATSAPPRWAGHVAMIDLHRLDHHPLSGWWWRLKDLAQLLYSSDVPGLTARDRLRFWRLYAGPDRTGLSGRLTRRLVLVRWTNYRGHNALRKAAA